MTLQQLRNLDALARTGHMRRASELVFLSQPSLSMSLSKLEKELGVPLLEHHGRTVSLTAAGLALEEHAQRILQEADEATRHMHSLSTDAANLIRLGYVTPLARRYIPQKMRAFCSLPGRAATEFDVESGATTDLVRLLKNGMYDMIVSSDPGDDPKLKTQPLMDQELLLLSPKEAPVTVDTLAELEKLPLIGYPRGGAMDSYLCALQAREGLTLHFGCRSSDEAAIAALVAQGFGCAVVANVDDLDDFDLHRQVLPGGYLRTIYLVTLKGQHLAGAARRFAQFL